jgi:hypothetical protein
MRVNRSGQWKKQLIIVLVIVLAGMSMARAQYLTIGTDRKDILLGEQFVLTIKLTTPQGRAISSWPSLPDSVNHLEVIERGNIDSVREGSKMLYTQKLIMTGFDSGHWVISPLKVVVDGKDITSASADINVQSIKLEGAEYNDIKEIIDVPPPGPDWKSILLYGVGIALLLALIYFWWRNKNREPKTLKPVSRGTAYDEAIKALEALRQAGLPEKGEMKKYYSGLYDIFRVYGTALSGKNLMQQTTDELLLWMKDSLVGEPFSKQAEVLRICDAVKFAKYSSSRSEAEQSISVIRNSIDVLNKKKI